MDSREKLQRQMAEIGNRYLKRTLGELPRMREIIAGLRGGALDAVTELEHLAHRIHGSGAMFGFDTVSEQARRIEMIASTGTAAATQVGELEKHLGTLETMVLDAARDRGLEIT